MRRLFSKSISRWLLPIVLILFISEVLSLPMVLELTYTGRSESPELILSYTEGKLTWSAAAGIDEKGAAELSLFDAVYEHAQSADGSNIVAPGTEGLSIVRLKNDAGGSIRYTAVLYSIKTNDALPVEAALAGEGLTDTADYPLPEGVAAEQVIRAAEGTVKGGEIADFDISWIWEYNAGAEQDAIDTILSNQAEGDRITVGLYLAVEDNNSYILPENPHTGDGSNSGLYWVLMLISLVLLILLLAERLREKKRCEQQ